MKKILCIIIIGSFLFGCNSSDTNDTKTSFDSSLSKNAVTTTVPNAVTDSSVQVQNVTPVVPTTTTVPAPTTAPAPQINTTSSNTAGLNPAHGQPGHRCDIAVGAPLNSPASKPTAISTTTNNTQPVVTATTPAPVKTAPGMNPPHGQPGHRCDISVGAPLNSAPVKPATATKPAAAGSVATDAMSAEAVKKDSSSKN